MAFNAILNTVVSKYVWTFGTGADTTNYMIPSSVLCNTDGTLMTAITINNGSTVEIGTQNTISGTIQIGTSNSVVVASLPALATGTNSIGIVQNGTSNNVLTAGTVTLTGSPSVSLVNGAIVELGTSSSLTGGTLGLLQAGTVTTVGAIATGSVTLTGSPIVSTIPSSSGQAIKGVTGSLASSATTADQVIATYTVTAGKTLYVAGIVVSARLTTFAATATNFGLASLETPSGTKVITFSLAGAGSDRQFFQFHPPIPVAASTVIRFVTTPAVATAITWNGSIIGVEQ